MLSKSPFCVEFDYAGNESGEILIICKFVDGMLFNIGHGLKMKQFAKSAYLVVV